MAARANHLSQSLRLSSLYGLFQISFASSFMSAPSTGLSASFAHAAISAFPAWIRSSIYRCTATGSGSPLPDADFQQGGANVHSDGFYQPLRQVALLHGSGRKRFSQPHRVSGYALLLYSPIESVLIASNCPSISVRR